MAERFSSEGASAACVRFIVDACIGQGRYRPSELLSWLVDVILQGFGVRCDRAPEDLTEWLRKLHLQYARAVKKHPFDDVLGNVYQELASRGHRGALGQFFSPASIGQLMSSVIGGDAEEAIARKGNADEDDLVRVCEPACGSGALLLAFMRSVVASGGKTALEGYSFTAIDLDRLCARICAAQILVNMHIHQHSVGELVVYHGDTLSDPAGLQVVIHASIRSLRADLVLPALHPNRIAALRDAAAGVEGDDEASTARRTSVSKTRHEQQRMVAEDDEPDLFSAEPG